MSKSIQLKTQMALMATFVFSMILFGCTTTQQPFLKTPSAILSDSEDIAIQQPIIGLTPSEDWLTIRKTQRKFYQVHHVNTNDALLDSFQVKLAKVKLLYHQVVNDINTNRHLNDITSSKHNLEEAINILSSLLSHPEFEPDSMFSQLSLYVLQTYDRHIVRLQDLDTDNPAFLIYERLFGISETKEVNENLFLGFVLPETEVPLILTPDVKKFITFYSTRFHDVFQRYLDRAEIYFPMMTPIFNNDNIPQELIYLSIVESGVNPKARSRASAIGIWQFIKSTGRIYGLYNNHWFDERQHVEKSTRSATKHLTDLYNRYGDWYLALAAYNAGSGKVNRAIRKAKSRSFWKIRRYLRRETREYVPRFIAATIIAMHPERFGFRPLNWQPVLSTTKIPTNGCIPLSYIAEKTSTDLQTLKFLNPELLQEVIPPAYPDYELIVPEENADEIAGLLQAIPDDQKLHFKIHKVRNRFDYISTIADKYGIDVNTLKKINGIRNNVIPKGKVMMIPTSPELASLKSYSKAQLSDDSRLRRRWQRRRYAQKKVAPSALVQAYREAQSRILSEIN